ncbi:MAG: glutamine synthetase, partial [Hyphomonadaceae bacterium]
KRTVRHAAMRHKVYATFMAKPLADEPGSAMHIHQSVVDKRSGRNLFGDKNGRDTALFRSHVAGLQRYLPMVMPLLAPNVNSYRRLQPFSDAPINVQWGVDNRTVGLRVPVSNSAARRIENRLAGADANPYLAIAAVLVCGYIGIRDKIEPNDMVQGSAYKWARTLPRTLREGLDRFRKCEPVIELLGAHFCGAFRQIKDHELANFDGVISSWERDHLLLKV